MPHRAEGPSCFDALRALLKSVTACDYAAETMIAAVP